MKIGFRIPSLKKRIAARTSLKRLLRHNLGIKAPRGMGWITNPKRAAYNRVYNRTTRGCIVTLVLLLFLLGGAISFSNCSDSKSGRGATYVKPSVDRRGRFRKGHIRMPVSAKKDAMKSRNKSRYYYHTRGKYNRRKN